jgi:glycerol-3-phosphate acyltransferase PlsY
VVIGGLVWLLVFEIRRIVSLASMAAVVAIAVSALVLRVLGVSKVSWPGIILLVIVAALVIVRHRENIARLRNGTENTFPVSKDSQNE